MTLLSRAGYAPRLPKGFDKLCCGQMLASKGMAEEADGMSATLEAALMEASENGRYPVIMDASACTTRMQQHLAGRLKLYDFHEFAHDALLPRLMISKEAARLRCTSIAACAEPVRMAN
jgi:D-lactate dehydrogenase